MAIVTGSVIIGTSALASAGIQAWFNADAQEQALKEHRRSERLQIKFAEAETEREEGRFSRKLGFEKERFEFQKGNAVVAQTQNQMNSMMNMFSNNNKLSNQLVQNLRGRK